MVVFWSPNAKNTLRNIFDYYLDVAGRKVAKKIVEEVRKTAHSLGAMPFMGVQEEELPVGYRSLVGNKNFKVVYRVNEIKETVEVVTIFDCRQNPSSLKRGIAG